MKNFLGALVSAVAIILLFPTGLILASWNAIPGDSLYGIKRDFEGIALAITVNTPLASTFSLNFTDRRFSEANQLLAQKDSTVGYTLLVAEAKQTKDIIVRRDETQKAEVLVAKINEYQTTIKQKQLVLQAQTQTPGSTAFPPTPAPQNQQTLPPQPRVVPTNPPAAAPQTITPENTSVAINNLQTANDDLEKIKHDLEKNLREKGNEDKGKQEIRDRDKGNNKD